MANPADEQDLINDLGGMYSDMHKELYGRRPRGTVFKTVEEAEAAVEQIWGEYAAHNRAQEEQEKQDLEYIEMEKRMQELMPDEYDIELPMHSGMGRRTRNVRGRVMHMKETALRQLVATLIEGHVDGHPFPGTLEELAEFHSKFWAHGSIVDPGDWKNNIKIAGQYTVGNAPSIVNRKKALKETIKGIVKKHVR